MKSYGMNEINNSASSEDKTCLSSASSSSTNSNQNNKNLKLSNEA